MPIVGDEWAYIFVQAFRFYSFVVFDGHMLVCVELGGPFRAGYNFWLVPADDMSRFPGEDLGLCDAVLAVC